MNTESTDTAILSAIIRQATADIGNHRFVLSPEAEAILVAKLQLHLAQLSSNHDEESTTTTNLLTCPYTWKGK